MSLLNNFLAITGRAWGVAAFNLHVFLRDHQPKQQRVMVEERSHGMIL